QISLEERPDRVSRPHSPTHPRRLGPSGTSPFLRLPCRSLTAQRASTVQPQSRPSSLASCRRTRKERDWKFSISSHRSYDFCVRYLRLPPPPPRPPPPRPPPKLDEPRELLALALAPLNPDEPPPKALRLPPPPETL